MIDFSKKADPNIVEQIAKVSELKETDKTSEQVHKKRSQHMSFAKSEKSDDKKAFDARFTGKDVSVVNKNPDEFDFMK